MFKYFISYKLSKSELYKTLVFVLVLFLNAIFTEISAQTHNDLGRLRFDDVKRNNKNNPCEVTERKILRYCFENGNFIIYTFDNDLLDGISFLTASLTRFSAEQELQLEVDDFSKQTGLRATLINGLASFDIDEKSMAVFQIQEINETYYVFFSLLSK